MGRGRAGEKRLVENVNKGHNWARLVLLGKHGHRHSITEICSMAPSGLHFGAWQLCWHEEQPEPLPQTGAHLSALHYP